MSRLVVDTNVVSYAFRGDSRAAVYAKMTKGSRLYLSFMSLAELLAWSEIHAWGMQQRTRLESFLRQYRILYPDRRRCEIWSELSRDSVRAGRLTSAGDLWVAATAVWLNASLVTHNAKHFEHLPGLTVLTANN